MGMFDSIYDSEDNEWQTKALSRVLAQFSVGDAIPGPPIDYQMEVLDGPLEDTPEWSFATIRGGRVTEVPVDRDPTLPLQRYSSGWEPAPEGA